MNLLDRILRLIVAIAGMAVVAAVPYAQAQDVQWPNRPVRLIVPYAPGGGADMIARTVGQELTELWGQSVIVENMGGAGGNIATAAAAKASPDGYTIYLAGEFIVMNKFLYPQLKFDALRDFAAVSLVVKYPVIIVVPSDSPYKAIGDFIEQGRLKAEGLTFASPGLGSSPHLVGELFKKLTKLQLVHVPYRGAAPALQDLLPGRVDSFFSNVAAVTGQLKEKTIRGLAVTSNIRSPIAPDVPTMVESGFPELDVSGWYALLAPAGTPASIVEKMSADLAAILGKPSVKSKLEQVGLFVVGSKPGELETFLRSEVQRWGPISTALASNLSDQKNCRDCPGER